MSFVSFITPTMWRPTLERTLLSMQAQTDPDWECVIVADPAYFPGSRLDDPRIVEAIPPSSAKKSAGLLRNDGILTARSGWVAFVDDDDTIDPHYVEWLKEYEETVYDVVVFRMQYRDGRILPPPDSATLAFGQVGISYAIRTPLARAYPFVREDVDSGYHEDWELIRTLYKEQFPIHISSHVAYYVRPE